MKDDSEQVVRTAKVLGVPSAGVLDDSGQLELLVSRGDEDPHDERLHVAIIAGVPLSGLKVATGFVERRARSRRFLHLRLTDHMPSDAESVDSRRDHATARPASRRLGEQST